MAKNPDDRYATARDLADDLARFSNKKPIAAHPPTMWQRTVRWSRRHASLVIIGCAALSVTTIVAVVATCLTVQAYRDKAAQTARADNRSRITRAAVDEMYTKVAERWLSQEPRMTELQREFLEKAAQVYEQIAKEDSIDKETEFNRAEAQLRLAIIYHRLQHKTQFQQYIAAATSALNQLTNHEPGNLDYRYAFSRALIARGIGLSELGRPRAALESLRDAQAECGDLIRLAPNESKFIAGRANALSHLGSVEFRLRLPEAIITLREAIATYDRLLESAPTQLNHQLDRAAAALHLGTALLDSQDWKPAITLFDDINAHLDAVGPAT